MLYSILADGVLVFHMAFIVFVVVGGFLVWRWPRVVWVHIPVAIYGALIEFIGWTCPLTPLEQDLRTAADQAGYEGSFVEHYLVPIIYPAGYTWELRMALGAGVVLANVIAYGGYVWMARRRAGEPTS